MLDLHAARLSVEDFYRRTYWQAPDVTTVSTPDYTLTYSGVTWLYTLNLLWMHRLDRLDDGLLEEAEDFFFRFSAEYSIVITEGDIAYWAHWLTERRYTERASTPIYGLQGIPRPQHVFREAEIVRACVDDQQALRDVLYSAFFMGPEIGQYAVRPEQFDDPTIRHYLAYVNNDIAACATILLNDHVASVWNVGTLRQYRRQGIASAILMLGLVEAAADGCSNSVLVATPMGKPLYQQMGYELLGGSLFYGPGD